MFLCFYSNKEKHLQRHIGIERRNSWKEIDPVLPGVARRRLRFPCRLIPVWPPLERDMKPLLNRDLAFTARICKVPNLSPSNRKAVIRSWDKEAHISVVSFLRDEPANHLLAWRRKNKYIEKKNNQNVEIIERLCKYFILRTGKPGTTFDYE